MIRCPHCNTEIAPSWLIIDTVLLLVGMLSLLLPWKSGEIDQISDALEHLKNHPKENA